MTIEGVPNVLGKKLGNAFAMIVCWMWHNFSRNCFGQVIRSTLKLLAKTGHNAQASVVSNKLGLAFLLAAHNIVRYSYDPTSLKNDAGNYGWSL